MADKGTKMRWTKDDWGVSDNHLLMLQLLAGKQVTCDTFAKYDNARCSKFYTEIPCATSAGINAFSNSWEADFNWVCPPVRLIPFVIKHIKCQKCEGILIIPRWPTAILWPIITTDGSHLIPIFKDGVSFKSKILVNHEKKEQAFKSRSTLMLGLMFDTNKEDFSN